METKTAHIKQLNGITLVGKTDTNHWITMDGPEDFGGSNASIRPKELILLSLGGCTSSDVIAILQKKRIKLEKFEMNISAEETDEHPKYYKSINLEYVIYGKGIKEADVQRAIELSQDKYCGVTFMLKSVVQITHNFRIVETES